MWTVIGMLGTVVAFGVAGFMRKLAIDRMHPYQMQVVAGIVTGQHWKSQEVASRLIEVFSLYGFTAEPQAVLSWQRTDDMNEEQMDNNAPIVAAEMKEERYSQIIKFVSAGLGL